MVTNSSIQWTQVTWNPTTGCDRVAAGCDNCYALALAKRLKAMGVEKYQADGDPRTSGPGFGVAIHLRLRQRGGFASGDPNRDPVRSTRATRCAACGCVSVPAMLADSRGAELRESSIAGHHRWATRNLNPGQQALVVLPHLCL